MICKPSIFISGPMAGVDEYRTVFNNVAAELTAMGYIVLNPAFLPQGLRDNAYMPICLAMVNAADMFFILPNSRNSVGCSVEQNFARYQNKPFLYTVEDAQEYIDWVNGGNDYDKI